jgi:ketosteroid isomerase-like protein
MTTFRWRPIAALSSAVLAVTASTAFADENYAVDRALVEDLQARYLFALDFRDAEAYARTFTEDGVLDYGAGEIKGRQAIRELIQGMRQREAQARSEDTSGLRPSAGRHNITNIVLEVNGNRARARAYWFHHDNDNPERSSSVTSYGHYEDELERVDDQWLFSRRKIYNEQVADWAATSQNPAW